MLGYKIAELAEFPFLLGRAFIEVSARSLFLTSLRSISLPMRRGFY